MKQIYLLRLPQQIIKFFALIVLCFVFSGSVFAQNTDLKLSELRHQFAVNYLKPEAHFALAKYYLEKDNKLQAFFILEYARRYRFSETEFDASFTKFFGDNSAEPTGEAKQAFEEGSRFLKESKLDEAEKSYVKAAGLAPKSAFIQTWVGRFFFKAKPDHSKALKYYFTAYFLDPHAYDTEYAESRIRNISLSSADAWFSELLKSGKSLADLAADDNPLIVSKAVEQMARQWKKEYIKPLLECMSNDDDTVRWSALTVLMQSAGPSADEIISTLSTEKDLRKRGLAAYAIIQRRKEKGFDIVRKMLADNTELIRFDAISALVQEGGPAGLEIVREHRKVEVSPILKKMIDQTLSNPGH